ncbi:sulfotransferase family domain-containing protein [Fusarium heterosporum]|uniref:Sulfotransferase family domain-containing protein n=1 Tax=Fusarium heterosporum TaxID=42747 RepID=A0A8H5T421_FUSHE|nr:sulfotransferase family domain-containing protein [Fusarium heterosporum]
MNGTKKTISGGDVSNATIGHPNDVFLYALNRTCSHVLCRLLSNQPEWDHSDYHFKRAFDFARDSFNWGPLNSVSDQQRQGFEKLLQEGFDEIKQERRSISSQGKATFLKEHTFYIWEPSKLSQSMWGGSATKPFTVREKGSGTDPACNKTNPTIFPDSFVSSWRPIFLIRHPALTFESWYRAESGARDVDLADRSWSFYTTYEYSRQLYDWYLSKNPSPGREPIVIDADDILDKSPTIERLCVSLGMDENKVLYEWDAIEAPENAGCRELKFMTGYWNSTSVDSSKSSRGLDINVARSRWEKDFGAETAAKLWKIVEGSMEDYEYLKSNKL